MEHKFQVLGDYSRDSEQESLRLLGRLAQAASPQAVFSEPVQMGSKKVITASEISLGLGFGFGLGSGPHTITNLAEGAGDLEEETGLGSGGGGGGGAGARPVAVITLDEDQVTVEPILDFTKLGLAFLTMLGSIFFFGAQMKKGQ